MPETIPPAPTYPAIRVTLPSGGHLDAPAGTPVKGLLSSSCASSGLPFLGALINNDVCSMSYPVDWDCRLEPLTFADRHGFRIYRRSLAFLLAKAVRDVFPDADFCIEHAISKGFYCEFTHEDTAGMSDAQAKDLLAHMQQMVDADLPIVRRSMSFEQVVDRLTSSHQEDKLNLLQFRNPPKLITFHLGDFMDLDQGVMAPSTGCLPQFNIIPYQGGCILQFPEWGEDTMALPAFHDLPHLFDIFQEHKRWGRVIGQNTVGDLNATVMQGELTDLIRTSEAFHEKKLGYAADAISEHRDRLKWLLIAGPSSAGKTTTSKRLAVHLRVCGLNVQTLEVDNYFVDRAHTPRDETGDYDFEHIEAIDLALLGQHLKDLAAGKEIDVPTFNFRTGEREYNGKKLRLEEDQVIIMEGIHCLNPRLTEALPDDSIYRVYINCITQLRLDNNNRLSTTDVRLIRRLVRDHHHRGHSARRTLQLWGNVRRGEKRWIFPHQENADLTINSSMDYELSVLKPHARPLLAEVKTIHEEYPEARRLLDFLQYVNGALSDEVPGDSLLREFIGGSVFD